VSEYDTSPISARTFFAEVTGNQRGGSFLFQFKGPDAWR
jgi:hypothetical protein